MLRHLTRVPWTWLAASVAALALADFIVLGLLGAGNDEARWALIPLVVITAVALAAALFAWRSTSDRLEEREEELNEERERRDRAERAWEAERRWNRELRTKVLELQHERGALGDPSDLPSLVLRTAIALLEAEKGLLLSRRDRDSDGDLDFVRSHGFEHNPEHSAVAQFFARKAIERDRTVHEDDIEVDERRKTPADYEIDNLVAVPMYVRDKFSGVVVCANRPGGFREFDEEVLLALGDHAAAVLENAQLHGELRNSYLATLRMMTEAIEAKDPFLRGHSIEVSGYVAAVADELGFERKQLEELVFASLLHDVGKLGISERILLKPGPLTAEERSVIQLHPRIGYRLVYQVPALRPVALAILHHHERFDGAGYPSGLRGEEIPLEARLIAVADAFSAMTADRPYTGRLSLDEACDELKRCAGTQFDPEVIRLFVDEVRRRPPKSKEPSLLAAALSDPEIDSRRAADEPVLGFGSFAVTDNLTLLYSHRYFHETAATEARRASLQRRPFGVVLVELTELDRINKEKGYAAGDAEIQVVAHAVQRAAVLCGGTACRDNGRRLGLIVPQADEQALDRVVADLEEDLSDGPPVRATTALWRPGETGDDVIERAREGLLADARLHAR